MSMIKLNIDNGSQILIGANHIAYVMPTTYETAKSIVRLAYGEDVSFYVSQTLDEIESMIRAAGSEGAHDV